MDFSCGQLDVIYLSFVQFIPDESEEFPVQLVCGILMMQPSIRCILFLENMLLSRYVQFRFPNLNYQRANIQKIHIAIFPPIIPNRNLFRNYLFSENNHKSVGYPFCSGQKSRPIAGGNKLFAVSICSKSRATCCQ